jgi:hypothetical protein
VQNGSSGAEHFDLSFELLLVRRMRRGVREHTAELRLETFGIATVSVDSAERP